MSHTKCGAGGSHSFSNASYGAVSDDSLLRRYNCGRCDEIRLNEMFVADKEFKYLACENCACGGLDGEHMWSFEKAWASDSNVSVVRYCSRCDCTRSLLYRHKCTEYIDSDGNVIRDEYA